MTEPKRLSRYQRNPTAFANLTLKEIDIEIIKLVYGHRFLTIDLIAPLLGIDGSKTTETAIGRDGKERPVSYGFGEKALYKRLQALYHAKYLERHRFTDYPIGRGFGSSPAIYGIGLKGADIIAEISGVPATELKRLVERDKVGTPFLRHALQIASFRTTLELACRTSDMGVRLLFWEQGQHLLDYAEGPNERRENERFSVCPDAFFALGVEGKGSVNYFLEVDRGTMPIVSASNRRPDIRKKILGYYHYRRLKKQSVRYFYRTTPDGSVAGLGVNENPRQENLFPPNFIRGFTVLFLVPGAIDTNGHPIGRLANILALFPMLATVIHPSKSFFWFAPPEAFDLHKPESVFYPLWITSNPIKKLAGLLD